MSLAVNVGCGYDHRPGWVNVDAGGACDPDIVAPVEVIDYYFEESSVDLLMARHLLEHLGSYQLKKAIEAIWHVMKPGGEVIVITPYGDHSSAWADPDHRRPFYPESFLYWDRRIYWRSAPYGLWDFSIEKVELRPDVKRYNSNPLDEGVLTEDLLRSVAKEMEVTLRAVKPEREPQPGVPPAIGGIPIYQGRAV